VQFTHALNKYASIVIFAWLNLCKLLIRPLALPDLGGHGLKRRVVRLMVEEASCQSYEKISPGERVCSEVISPGGSPVPAIEL
jgi:hypothetical protein